MTTRIFPVGSPRTIPTLRARQVADKGTRDAVKQYGSVGIAVGVTLYFFRQNRLGIRRSSDKALKIMIATTVMVAVMLLWCGATRRPPGRRRRFRGGMTG